MEKIKINHKKVLSGSSQGSFFSLDSPKKKFSCRSILSLYLWPKRSRQRHWWRHTSQPATQQSRCSRHRGCWFGLMQVAPIAAAACGRCTRAPWPPQSSHTPCESAPAQQRQMGWEREREFECGVERAHRNRTKSRQEGGRRGVFPPPPLPPFFIQKKTSRRNQQQLPRNSMVGQIIWTWSRCL